MAFPIYRSSSIYIVLSSVINNVRSRRSLVRWKSILFIEERNVGTDYDWIPTGFKLVFLLFFSIREDTVIGVGHYLCMSI